jgi:hypothetical protein
MDKLVAVATVAVVAAELVQALMMLLIPYKVDLVALAVEAVAAEWINLVSRPHQVVILLAEAVVEEVVLQMVRLFQVEAI